MKKVIVINIISGILFKETTKVQPTFHLREDTKNFLLSEVLEFRYLELGKIDSSKPPSEMNDLERVAGYFRHADDPQYAAYIQEILACDELKGGVLKMTDTSLTKVSENELMREKAEAREKFLFDQYLRETDAREEGMERGIEIGEQQGRKIGEQQGKTDMVANLLKMGVTIDIIAQASGLSAEEIKEIAKPDK